LKGAGGNPLAPFFMPEINLYICSNMPTNRLILDKERFSLVLLRLCYALIENHDTFEHTVLVGLQPRGVLLARRIRKELEQLLQKQIPYGELDITFYRDDFKTKPLIPNTTQMDFITEGKKVVLVDDVLFTGRSIRAGLDALQQFGRPEKVELLALVDRRWSREIPVSPDYVGITVDAVFNERVSLVWTDTDGPAEVNLLSKSADE
jgi:pyrimidine operon attenuation protein/uracil phosphoribosyltransferase